MSPTKQIGPEGSSPDQLGATVTDHDVDAGDATRRGRPARRWIRAFLLAVIAGVLLIPAAALAGERFGDVSAGGHAPAIGWVADVGVTQGCGDGKDYCPTDPVTRAQMASFMQRLAGHANGVAPSVNAATLDGLTVDDLTSNYTAAIDGTVAAAIDKAMATMLADAVDAAIDAAIDDALTGVVADLQTDNQQLRNQLDGLQDDISALTSRVADLETLLDGVSRDEDTVVFSGVNVQVVNGQDETESTNGVGNLILGYNEARSGGGDPASGRDGSHNLIVGTGHYYRSYAGIVAGSDNTTDGPYASVTGGLRNTASGDRASVTGGSGNSAIAHAATVSGGHSNYASGNSASITGGSANTASGPRSSVTGGSINIASGDRASIQGGSGNTASGERTSISAGQDNTANAIVSSITGGFNNTTTGNLSSVSGGFENTAQGLRSSVLGGSEVTLNVANGTWPSP